jgi:hypothetical protein
VTARKLAAVPDGARPPRQRKPRPKSITQAAADGDQRGILVGMRGRVATAVEDPNTPGRDLSSLTRRLMEITKEIEALDARAREGGPDGASAPDDTFDASTV